MSGDTGIVVVGERTRSKNELLARGRRAATGLAQLGMVGIARIQSCCPNVMAGLGIVLVVGQVPAVGGEGIRICDVLTREDLPWLSGAVAAHAPDPKTSGRRLEGHVFPVRGPHAAAFHSHTGQ